MSDNDPVYNSTFILVSPATQTPLFVAEYITCAYPVSDFYAASPRYLYYMLLLLVLVTQQHSWLTNVFLGVAATYAGTAAIEAFILTAYREPEYNSGNVTIPYISSSIASTNDTFSPLNNLITDKDTLAIVPQALDFDFDAVIAITVTGYLMMLPMHCWSSAVRRDRARHLLILLWNGLMAAGAVCSIVIWPNLYDSALQHRFCYPSITDGNSVTSDGLYQDESSSWMLNDDWNDTLWGIFSNYSRASNLPNNCFYPCFNTTQILRRPTSVLADAGASRSARLSRQLVLAGLPPITNIQKEANLAGLMYLFVILTTVVMFCLLLLVLTPMRNFIRVPVSRPRDLFRQKGDSLFHNLWQDCCMFGRIAIFSLQNPRTTSENLHGLSGKQIWKYMRLAVRFMMDIFALAILFFSMVVTPVVTVVWIYFIEWYIHRDLGSGESASQVGQWSTSVSVALVLVSALILQLKNRLATPREIEREVTETREHLEKLEVLLAKKQAQLLSKQGEDIPITSLSGNSSQKSLGTGLEGGFSNTIN